MTDLTALPWRQGRTQPRNVYARTGGEDWKADTMIGQLDTAEIAARACEAHNDALGLGCPGGMTAGEREAVRLAGQLYTFIRDNVVGDCLTRDDDLAEIRRSIHDIQYRVESQATARLYPGELRLLGEVVGEGPAP